MDIVNDIYQSDDRMILSTINWMYTVGSRREAGLGVRVYISFDTTAKNVDSVFLKDGLTKIKIQQK